MSPKMIPGTTIQYDPLTESALIRADDIPPEEVLRMRRVAKNIVYKAAREKYPNTPLYIRAMTPQDLGITNFEWEDTSGGSADAWEAHVVDAKTISDKRFCVIYGCKYQSLEAIGTVAITGLKFTVGGALVAQWDLYEILNQFSIGGGTAAGEVAIFKPALGLAESPILVSEGISLSISQWVRTASTAFVISLHGYTCETRGLTLNP